MLWLNNPAVIHSQTDTSVSFVVPPNTDYYKAPDLSIIADNALLYCKEVKGIITIINI
jgi:regulation of enolase protein 1 (concanavalin A-like superfamily)